MSGFGILGIGATGSALGAILAHNGLAVYGIGRERTGTIFGPAKTLSFDIELWQGEPLRAILVCLKAYHLVQAIGALPDSLKAIPLVIMSNGWVELDAFDHTFPGVISFGSRAIKEGEYRVTAGEALFPDFLGVEAHWDGLSLRSPEGVANQRVRKWIFNVAANTVAAWHMLESNGELTRFRRDVDRLFDRAFDYAVEHTTAIQAPQREALRADLWALVAKTSENRNSMVADIEAGRPNESRFLGGVISPDLVIR